MCHPIPTADKHRVTISSRRFVGPFELEDDSIVRVQVQGGYWDAEGEAHGFIGDWQGNVRAVRGSDGILEQRTDYYPYGAPSQSTNPSVNPYKFSGKRLETRYGLNLSHHGARLLLHDVALFAQPDPLAELNYGVNPYLYCSADPINRIDPTGLYETAKEALRAAEKYYPGRDVMITRDDLSGFWYIAYQSHGKEQRDFGPKNPYKLSSNSIMNLISSLGFSNDMKMLIAELGDSEFSQTPYGKFFSYVGKGVGLFEAGAAFWSMIKANKYGCKSDRIYYKFLLDAVLNLATMGDPEPGSKAYLLGFYYSYVVTDIASDGFGLNYEVTIPLFTNPKKKNKKK